MRRIGPNLVVGCSVASRRGSKPSQDPVLVELLRVTLPTDVAESSSGTEVFRRRGRVVRTVGDADGLAPGERIVIRDPVESQDDPPSLEGWAVRYAVRTVDRRGRRSSLVATGAIVPEAVPSAPRGLRGEAVAEGVSLVWDGDAEQRMYNVYRAVAEGPYGEDPVNPSPLESTEFVDGSVALGTPYRYVVRSAFGGESATGQESASSNETVVLAEDRFPPARPEGLVVVQEGPFVRLFWDPGPERDLAGYRVEREIDDGAWSPATVEAVAEARFLDRDVVVGQRIRYRVIAYDRASPPNESEPSDPVVIVVAADPGAGGGG